MKYFILLILFSASKFLFASNNPIIIDLGSPVVITKHYVKKGNLTVTINAKDGTYIRVAPDKSYNKYEPFIVSKTDEVGETQVAMSIKRETFKLEFGDNTKYVFDIFVYNIENNKQIENFKIEFISKSKWYWTTTFGVSGIFLVNRDTYKSVLETAMTDENAATYKIVNDGSQNQYNVIPTILFTYAKLENDYSHGWTAGLGTDFESLSIFGGYSFVLGQNIVFTGGLALHEQLRLDSKYAKGQLINNNANFDDLNEEYHRINPFFSISYRLNQNPYK